MLDFSNILDLPMIWGALIAVAVLMYVILDGFDLGVGILIPFAPSQECRSRMLSSIAPFWDGNETWLVLGGGGLFVAFPVAYSVLLPAFYMPIITMLLGLILRGVSFEFRFAAVEMQRKFWDMLFHFGSLIAAFSQGIILGAFIRGVQVKGYNFDGGPFDWATGFSIMTGIAMVFGYALLGATWTIMKTDGVTLAWARHAATYSLIFVAIFMGIVSVSMPFIDSRVLHRWLDLPNLFIFAPIPFITLYLFVKVWDDIRNSKTEHMPFLCSVGIFIMGYAGLAISLFPWIVPFHYDVWEAASAGPGLSLVLIGAVVLLPIILSYTAYNYYVFRGKTGLIEKTY